MKMMARWHPMTAPAAGQLGLLHMATRRSSTKSLVDGLSRCASPVWRRFAIGEGTLLFGSSLRTSSKLPSARWASPRSASPLPRFFFSTKSSSTSPKSSTSPSSPSASSTTTATGAPQGAAGPIGGKGADGEEPKSPTLAWLEDVEAKLARGGKKAKENALTRSARALRTELVEAVRAGRLTEAERLWAELRGRVGAPNMDEASFHILMNAYAQRGHVRRALGLYAHMREWRVRPSVHTYSILFNAFANVAKPTRAYIARLKQLKDEDMARFNVKPTVEIYNVLLKAYLALDPEECKKEVKQMINDMNESGLKPDDITYTLWMATAARGNVDNPKKTVDVAAAFEVWEEMRKNKVRPTLRGYNELLKICNEGTSQDRKIALELYKEMLLAGIGPDHHTFDILMMTCMKENRYEMANELFDKAVELSDDKKRNLTIDTHLCNSALRVCTRASTKQLKRAETGEQLLQTISKILRVMHRNHLSYNEDTYALLISAYNRAGAKDKAESTLEDMLRKRRVQVGRKIIGALMAGARLDNDVEAMTKAVELAIQHRVHIPENMADEARQLLTSHHRLQEWQRLKADLARVTPPSSTTPEEEADPAPRPLYKPGEKKTRKRRDWTANRVKMPTPSNAEAELLMKTKQDRQPARDAPSAPEQGGGRARGTKMKKEEEKPRQRQAEGDKTKAAPKRKKQAGSSSSSSSSS